MTVIYIFLNISSLVLFILNDDANDILFFFNFMKKKNLI